MKQNLGGADPFPLGGNQKGGKNGQNTNLSFYPHKALSVRFP